MFFVISLVGAINLYKCCIKGVIKLLFKMMLDCLVVHVEVETEHVHVVDIESVCGLRDIIIETEHKFILT